MKKAKDKPSIYNIILKRGSRKTADCLEKPSENDHVFKWDTGRMFLPDYITHHFSKLLKDNHLPHIRFHELRHSCASLLINQGFHLKDVQEWMGHSDIKMTANIYGHLDVERKQSMASQLSKSIWI